MSIGDPEVKVSTVLKTIGKNESFNITDRLSRFSNWSKVIGAVARIKRVAHNGEGDKGFSTPSERQDAEKFIIKSLQEQSFPKEIKLFQQNANVPKNSGIFIIKSWSLPARMWYS